jgi:atypical dual specificity phosphatase
MDYKKAILNFSFVIPNTLAGMARPGLSGPLAEDLTFLDYQGIKAIISLTETPLEEDFVRKKGFSLLHVPIDDFTAPTISDAEKCVNFFERMTTVKDRAVVVHCGAGCGRTGTILACCFVSRGKTADEAIEAVRAIRPCSIETESQKALIYHYEEHLKLQPPSN